MLDRYSAFHVACRCSRQIHRLRQIDSECCNDPRAETGDFQLCGLVQDVRYPTVKALRVIFQPPGGVDSKHEGCVKLSHSKWPFLGVLFMASMVAMPGVEAGLADALILGLMGDGPQPG